MASESIAAIMRLTPRDRTLVEVLNEVRYLTVAQIQRVCYPSVSVRNTAGRLSLLKRRGVLTCLTHRTFDDRRAFWGLSPTGRAVAGAVGAGIPPESTDRPRACAMASLQMDHLIATNQVFSDLCVQHRAGALGAFRWFGSHHAQVDLGDTHLVPDALILTATPEGSIWMYCLELDQGTMAPHALSAKFDRYRLFHRVANLRRAEPLWEVRAESWVLFACKDSARAAHGAQLAARAGLERVWAGTAGEVAASLAASVGPDTFVHPADLLPGLSGGVVPPSTGAPATAREGSQ